MLHCLENMKKGNYVLRMRAFYCNNTFCSLFFPRTGCGNITRNAESSVKLKLHVLTSQAIELNFVNGKRVESILLEPSAKVQEYVMCLF